MVIRAREEFKSPKGKKPGLADPGEVENSGLPGDPGAYGIPGIREDPTHELLWI